MLPLCNVILPINAAKFFGTISSIAAFEVYDFGEPINKMLDVPATEPYNDNFEELGFESRYMLNNMGTLFFFYPAYPALMLIHWILNRFCNCTLRCGKFQRSLKHLIYYKLIITVIFESYAIVAVSVLIGLQILDFSSAGLVVQSSICIIFTIFILLMPVMMFRHVTHHFAWLADHKMKRRVGTLYDELDIRKGKKIFIQPIFFLLRRLILAYTVVHMNDNFAGQIAVILLQTLTSLMILSFLEAFINGRRHNMELFNELIMLMTLYTIMCFSDWLGDLEVQFKIGYVACALIGFHFGLNLFLIIVTTVRVTKQRCRMRILRKKHAK